MDVQGMQVSLKVLKNARYKVLPVDKYGGNLKYNTANDPKDIHGIRLLNAKHGFDEWVYNRGVIRLDQLSPAARDYVMLMFTNVKALELFGGLGD